MMILTLALTCDGFISPLDTTSLLGFGTCGEDYHVSIGVLPKRLTLIHLSLGGVEAQVADVQSARVRQKTTLSLPVQLYLSAKNDEALQTHLGLAVLITGWKVQRGDDVRHCGTT